MEAMTGGAGNDIKRADTTHFRFPAQNTVSISRNGFFVITGALGNWEYSDGTFLSAYVKDGVVHVEENTPYGGVYTSLVYNSETEILTINQASNQTAMVFFVTKISQT